MKFRNNEKSMKCNYQTKLPIISFFKKHTSAVTSNSRGPRFESSHQQKFILNVCSQLHGKDENKEKEAWIGPFKKHTSHKAQSK